MKKIISIVSHKCDIVFLSDLRLGSNGAVPELVNTFRHNKYCQYDFHFSSTLNRRGVGILLNTKLNYSILDTDGDEQENIFCMKLCIDNVTFTCISAYGPNRNDEYFFNDLQRLISKYSNFPIVLGGDWNMTVSLMNNAENIDIINMASPPSFHRSRQLYDICGQFNLSDPYHMLYPDRRDFTYIPRTGTNNPSRIDFFLISNDLTNIVKECSIGEELTTALFDHKPIFLRFSIPENVRNNTISTATINHSLFPFIVTASAVETHLQHHVGLEEPHTQAALLHIGTVRALIRTYLDNALNEDIAGQLPVHNDNLVRDIENIVSMLPDPDELSTLELNCQPDIFFDVPAGNIINDIRSFQGILGKIDNGKQNRLRRRLELLKSNHDDNQILIFQLESELNAMVEKNLSDKIASIKIFENLNSEKPTPIFLNLIKNRSSLGLEKICSDTGVPFQSDTDREKHIFDTYSKLYLPRPGDLAVPENCIEEFLGPDILASDVVQNSKLNDRERGTLDAPLTLAELDISANKGKLRSAPGADGFSNVLIRKCWKFLRKPLLACANYCYTTGRLTPNFRSARTRLIPKKGDISLLKNWRPISLLSNLYKIISRAINTRLNAVVNRVCSRAQKGYNSLRYSQEVLINVWERINFCRKNQIRGAIVAIDMAKAFDTLSQSFVSKVYKFFNFGPCIIKWLELIGNNRQACISLGANRDSAFFNLGCGRPQGDNPSPNSFNFSEQILIFKLELDQSIISIPRNLPVLNNDNVDSIFRHESNGETNKNESLADDNTTLTMLDAGSLERIKQILIDFEVISGLACNFEKTCVMPIMEPTPAEKLIISNLSFREVDSITLLGVEITRNLDNINAIFNKILEKIRSLASFWERFRLSLSGRLTIAKTFLISQLNYVACWLIPPDDILNTIQVLIDQFVIGPLNVSRERLYLPAKCGGIGMFDLKIFLQAQRCAWISRAHRLRIDNWRHELAALSPQFCITNIRTCDIDHTQNPILYGIVESYEHFLGKFAGVKMKFLTLQFLETVHFQ
jgi:exonuclease III